MFPVGFVNNDQTRGLRARLFFAFLSSNALIPLNTELVHPVNIAVVAVYGTKKKETFSWYVRITPY